MLGLATVGWAVWEEIRPVLIEVITVHADPFPVLLGTVNDEILKDILTEI